MIFATLAIIIISVCAFTPARYFFGALTGSLDEAYVTYRLLSERDSLIAANQRLQDEVESLRVVRVSGPAFEASVRAQIEEIQGIIKSATALSLGDDEPVTVANSNEDKKTQLAATIGRSTKGSKSGKSSRESERAIGGGEHVCASEGAAECVGQVRKQNISMVTGGASSLSLRTVPDREGFYPPTIKDLKRRMKKLSSALRALPMGYPVEGDVTSGFGYRRSPFTRSGAFHEGMDISLNRGGEVFATGSGVVTAAGYHSQYGWMVEVAHSPMVVTRYAHLSKTHVKVGDKVRRGDRIALSGNTGRSTGPHLHYEVRVNGKPRNPELFALLPQKLTNIL